MQQGQVFQLRRRGRDGEQQWAYRYRTGGRDSRRIQRGGFVSEQDAVDALERELDRIRREQRIPAASASPNSSTSTSHDTTFNRSRSRSCAGCSGKRPPCSASGASAS
jgi:hypothetical protein